MKKITLALLLSLSSAAALAAPGGFSGPNNTAERGGFSGPGASGATVTANSAQKLRDDSWVSLEGHIVRQTGKERYEFRDNSGTITVDIDDHVWNGQTITPQDKVRLEGEVDKDWNSVEIDVKKITKL